MDHPLNTSDIKKTNRRLILDHIFRTETTSRTQLANSLSMSKPAISDNLSPLLEAGLVEEAGGSSAGPSGGRKQILLHFNPQNKYIITIDLSSNSVIFALSDLSGNIVNTFEIFVSDSTPVESCQDMLCNGVRVLQQSHAASADRIYCIAIGAPGTYDESGNLVSCNPGCSCPPWYLADLRPRLKEEFQLPIIVYNNIKSAALGEWIAGCCQQESNLLFLSTGLGIGVGILLNSRIFTGQYYGAGEIYDYIDSDASECSGNFESRVCLEFLKSQCSQYLNSPSGQSDSIHLEQIVDAYEQADPQICQVVRNACRRLAVMVFNQMNLLSLRLVCFAGLYAPFWECFREELLILCRHYGRPEPDVRKTELGKFGSTTGLIYLARQSYFDEICSK